MTAAINNNMQGGYKFSELQAPKLGQSDFLRLMVAQVQNQDPMSPQTNGDFIGQLAQFSTSDGVNNMQKSLDQLAYSMQSNETLQASALVGHEVLVNSNKMTLEGDNPANAAVEIPAGMKDLTVSIYSASGSLVKTIKLGQQPEGIHNFSWDGYDANGKKMADGQYNVKIQGNSQGREYPLPMMSSAKVESVRISQYGEGVILKVSGIGDVSLNDVRQIQSAK